MNRVHRELALAAVISLVLAVLAALDLHLAATVPTGVTP